jgi:hypothetical protein
MANELEPRLDQWYSFHSSDELFRVVALDDGAIEIQSFDGDIQELDVDAWRDLDIELAEPPENWTGPFDIEPDDVDDTENALRRSEAHAGLQPGVSDVQTWREGRSPDEDGLATDESQQED